ncbi:MAG: nucleotidyltransferase domain-containing protein [Patescibacteria group bacterium]|nr:nucleotidyltransferase domain-containing protein [Patescibacteria group bacterium]
MLSFKSKITQKVLSYFFVNIDAKHYINELSRILSLDVKNLYRKLKEMEEEGVLLSETMGRQKYYYLNNSYLLLDQYKFIFNKTLGVENLLRKVLESKADVLSAYIFGSYARDSMDIHSDIDLLVVGDCSTVEILKEISKIEKSIGRDINLINLSFAEYEKRRKKRNDIISKILKDRIIRIK